MTERKADRVRRLARERKQRQRARQRGEPDLRTEVGAAADLLAPTVSEDAPRPGERYSTWADRSLVVTAGPRRGDRWRCFPWQAEPMDLAGAGGKIVVLSCASQSGKTSVGLAVGAGRMLAGEPVLFVQPNQHPAGTQFARERLEPLLTVPPLCHVVHSERHGGLGKSSAVAFRTLTTGGSASLASAESPAQLAARGASTVILDEVARFPLSAGREGPPVSVAMERTTAWRDIWTMNKVYDLQLQDHDLVDKLNALEAAEKPDKSAIEAVEGERREVREKLREAMQTEADAQTTETDEPDREVRERLELRGRSRLGAFLLARINHRVLQGPEAEYAAAHKAGDGEIPIDLWESGRPREVRATTPAPSSGTGVAVAPVQPFVFAPSIAPLLGIDMPSVGSGGYSEMTITTAVQAAARAKGNDDDFSAAALTAVTTTNRRITARMSVTLEDVASVGADNFESALRQNTSMALSDAYDTQAINGGGTAPAISGLIHQLTNPTDPTAIATFDAFVASFADQIDGLWAGTMRDIAIVANVDAYKLSAKTFRDRVIDSGQRGGVSCPYRRF